MSGFTISDEQKAFDAQLPGLLAKHAGKFVLQRNGQVLGVFPDYGSAYAEGIRQFGPDESFFIAKVEEVRPQPVSYARLGGVMFGTRG